jgi:hypothetical protein
MQAGRQTVGISYWEHGELVAARFRDLMNPNPSMTWKLPKFFEENSTWIRAELQVDFELISTYQTWHDLGKPYCRVEDSEGKIHYPEHATISARREGARLHRRIGETYETCHFKNLSELVQEILLVLVVLLISVVVQVVHQPQVVV